MTDGGQRNERDGQNCGQMFHDCFPLLRCNAALDTNAARQDYGP
jgi:hypothetical protein